MIGIVERKLLTQAAYTGQQKVNLRVLKGIEGTVATALHGENPGMQEYREVLAHHGLPRLAGGGNDLCHALCFPSTGKKIEDLQTQRESTEPKGLDKTGSRSDVVRRNPDGHTPSYHSSWNSINFE
jgi:hypothetical protein